jgi:dihydrofolate reductase
MTVQANISMSLDGYVTGPDLDHHPGLGAGGEALHAWVGEDRAMDLAFGEERQIAGSVVTSRRVYDDTDGWRSEDGFFRLPVFVVTHRPHEDVVRGETRFTFVTGGVAEAIARAGAAAGDRLVHIMGGAGIVRQALAAGLVDELFLHVAPILLDGGTPLFGDLGRQIRLERLEQVETRHATHLRYRVLR